MDRYPQVTKDVFDGSLFEQKRIDNFYLDMNGIIHTATHAQDDQIVTLNEREMFQRIFTVTDRLYKLVRYLYFICFACT